MTVRVESPFISYTGLQSAVNIVSKKWTTNSSTGIKEKILVYIANVPRNVVNI